MDRIYIDSQTPRPTDLPINSTTMRDIFSDYNTGDRQWTFERQTFTEYEFRDLFEDVFPNEVLHDAAAAYLYREWITVHRFSVPMQRHPAALQRDVYFIEVPGSQYCEMYSFVYFQTSPLAGMIADHYENAQLGLMTEYEILDLVEPTNDRHQRALIDTWFDIDNWFDILSVHDIADHPRLDNIVNGYDPERQLDPVADAFVPELGPMNGMNEMNDMNGMNDMNENQGAIAYWDVRQLIEPWVNRVNNDNNNVDNGNNYNNIVNVRIV